MLDKIFSKAKKKTGESTLTGIQFGRYSDNNKSLARVDEWNEAENLFKERKYQESIQHFFEYLKDDEIENLTYQSSEMGGRFAISQGSKIIHGEYDGSKFKAWVALAAMPSPSVPVMRRLLEMNFNLYYTRYAIHDSRLVMLFDSEITTANPSKLYYGLKEIATKADKHDDLLVQDFITLRPIDQEHLEEIPESEKAIKHSFFLKWINDTLNLIEQLDADKYSGGIAYLLLALAYRIDYLIVPHGKLLSELEKIVDIYFRKDERQVTEKNQDMMDCFAQLARREKEEFYPYLFRSRYTFSIVTPQNYKSIADAIYNANQNIGWYRDNKQPEIAARISEYGFAYCQFSYSLPRPLTELFHLFMQINYPDFFTALGDDKPLYNESTGQYDQEGIFARIRDIESRWNEKYPEFKFKTDKLKFDNPVVFNYTYTTEIEYLNMETA